MWSRLNKVAIAIFVFFFSIFGIQSSYADPGRTFEINVNALTYANANPTNLSSEFVDDPNKTMAVYKIYGVRASDTFIFNLSNVSNVSDRDYYEIFGYFRNSAGFSGIVSKNNVVVTPVVLDEGSNNAYILIGDANLDSYGVSVTLGQDPDFFFSFFPNTPTSGLFGFPSDSNGLSYVWELYSSEEPAPAPAPAPKPVETYVRKSTNLQFNEAMYGSDKLSDPDGQLRKTVDAIDAKYGNLIK
jgi:hypothetical protein